MWSGTKIPVNISVMWLNSLPNVFQQFQHTSVVKKWSQMRHKSSIWLFSCGLYETVKIHSTKYEFFGNNSNFIVVCLTSWWRTGILSSLCSHFQPEFPEVCMQTECYYWCPDISAVTQTTWGYHFHTDITCSWHRNRWCQCSWHRRWMSISDLHHYCIHQ